MLCKLRLVMMTTSILFIFRCHLFKLMQILITTFFLTQHFCTHTNYFLLEMTYYFGSLEPSSSLSMMMILTLLFCLAAMFVHIVVVVVVDCYYFNGDNLLNDNKFSGKTKSRIKQTIVI